MSTNTPSPSSFPPIGEPLIPWRTSASAVSLDQAYELQRYHARVAAAIVHHPDLHCSAQDQAAFERACECAATKAWTKDPTVHQRLVCASAQPIADRLPHITAIIHQPYEFIETAKGVAQRLPFDKLAWSPALDAPYRMSRRFTRSVRTAAWQHVVVAFPEASQPRVIAPQIASITAAICGFHPHYLRCAVHDPKAPFYRPGTAPSSTHMHLWLPLRLPHQLSMTFPDLVPALHVALSAIDIARGKSGLSTAYGPGLRTLGAGNYCRNESGESYADYCAHGGRNPSRACRRIATHPVFDDLCLRTLAGVLATQPSTEPLANCRIRGFDPMGPTCLERGNKQQALYVRLQHGCPLTRADQDLIRALEYRGQPGSRQMRLDEMIEHGAIEALVNRAYATG